MKLNFFKYVNDVEGDIDEGKGGDPKQEKDGPYIEREMILIMKGMIM